MAQSGFTPIQLYFSTTAAATPSAGNLANGELAVNITDGKLFYKDNGGVVRVLATAAGAAGDVVGPGSSTDNALVRFDGTTGKLVQSSVGVLSDAGVLTGLTGLTSSGSITFSGLTSGRVTYAGTGGLLQDSANLTFDGTTLTANALTVSNAVTLSGGTANGVAYLNGSKVLTTGSALTFDGTNFTGPRLVASSTDATGSVIQVDTSATAYGQMGGSNSMGWKAGSQHIWNITAGEQMRLTSTGLGIGTSSPATKLHVYGAGANSRLENSGATTSTQFTVKNTVGTVTLGLDSSTGGGFGVANAAVLWYDAAQPLVFGTSNTERMRLDSSGNLGLGVTPSASSLPTLQSTVAILVGSSETNVTSNAYYNSGWKYVGTGLATQYQANSGLHKWFNAASGTAGNAISFTQAMTLDASGKLQLNATSTAGGYFTLNTLAQAGLDIYRSDVDANYNGIRFRNTTNTTTYGSLGWDSGGLRLDADAGTMYFSTANTERMRITSAGDVGIGTTAPGRMLTVAPVPFSAGQLGGIRLINTSNVTSSLFEVLYGIEAVTGIPFGSLRTGNDGNSFMTFFTGSGPTERARITSTGDLLVGTTTVNGADGLTISPGSNYSAIAVWNKTYSGNVYAAQFRHNGTIVGTIEYSNTATSFVTSSDYRLKEDIAPMTGALAKVQALKPVTYKWKADGSDGEGFIAHELQEVCPDAVSGEKDAVNEDGSIKAQGIDTSFLVATLTAAIQELKAEFDAYKATHP